MGDRGPDTLWVEEFNTHEALFYLLTPVDLQLMHKCPSLGSALVREAPVCSAVSFNSSLSLCWCELAPAWLTASAKVSMCAHVCVQQQQWAF